MRGITCSGKSTLARKMFGNYILASDDFRAMLTGDANSQHMNKEVFDLIRQVMDVRMSERSIVCVDATNLRFNDSAEYFELAAKWGYEVVVINVLPYSVEEHVARSKKRRAAGGIEISQEVIEKQLNRFIATTDHYKTSAIATGRLHKWVDVENDASAEDVAMYVNSYFKVVTPRFVAGLDEEIYAIGDVHGCLSEMIKLMDKCHIDASLTGKTAKFIMMGDYIDRGPYSVEVLRHIRDDASVMCAVLGNHEWLLIQEFNGKVCRSKSRAITHDQITEKDCAEEVKRYICSLPAGCFVTVGSQTFVFTHGPMDVFNSSSYTSFRQHSMSSKQVSYDTLRESQVSAIHIHAHLSWKYVDIHQQLEDQKALNSKQLNIDSGCVFGGVLTAIKLKDLTVLQVESTINAENEFHPKRENDNVK